MSATPEVLQQIHKTLLFHEFTEEELRRCLELVEIERVSAGECIVHQDELGDSMYLLVEGRADVIHHSEGRDIRLAQLKPGEFFGELALVDKGPRSADVEALTECTLIKITQATISAIAGVYPSAAFKFLLGVGRMLVGRLRQTNRRYVDSLLFPVTGKD